MEQLQVFTAWTDTADQPGGEGGLQPQISIDYPNLKQTRDIVHTPAENLPNAPNMVLLLIIDEAAVLDAIEADPDYPVMPGTRGPYNG